MCDANLFTKRNFRQDRHSDLATGAVLTILDQILVSANKLCESSKLKRITYNWEVSTLATEQLPALEGRDADVDCLTQIALNYAKDMHTLLRRSSDIPEDQGHVGYEGPPRQKETTIEPNEFLKHLNHFDFCLESNDEAFHHPFQCNFSLAARSNNRARGEASAEHRRQKDNERIHWRRQERQDWWQSRLVPVLVAIRTVRPGLRIQRLPQMVKNVHA